MCDGQAGFYLKNVYKWAKLFKEDQNCIQDEDSSGRPSMANTTEMIESVNAFIFADRRIITEDISEQLVIFVGRAHKILHVNSLLFLRSVVVGFPKKLTPEQKALYCSKNI